jgi:hypothetical protein
LPGDERTDPVQFNKRAIGRNEIRCEFRPQKGTPSCPPESAYQDSAAGLGLPRQQLRQIGI